MAYVRRRSSKRRFRRRANRSTIAKIAKSVLNKNVENKYQTYDLTTLGGIGTAGSLVNINVLAQGTSATTRVGNLVKWTSVRFNGWWTGADSTNIVRMMVLWSRAPLQLSNMPTAQNPINPAQQNFKCLYDRTFKLESSTTSSIHQQVLPRTVYRRINGNSRYDDASTTPDAGFLYFYFISDSGATQHPYFTGQAIISFQDA